MKIEIAMNKEEFLKMLKVSMLPVVPANCEIVDIEARGYPDKEFICKLETKGEEEKI